MPDPQLRIRVSADTAEARRQLTGLEGTFTELNSMVNLAITGIQAAYAVLQSAYENLIQPTIDYSNQVRDLSLLTGETTEQSSQLLTVLADLGVTSAELESAMRTMKDNGLNPTVATMARLSDEYLRLNPGLERQNFLAETFGERIGPEFARIMSLGGEAIRDMASAIPEALQLTAADQAAVAELEIAQLGLNQAWHTATTIIGLELIPALTRLLNNLMAVQNAAGQTAAEFQHMGSAAREAGGTGGGVTPTTAAAQAHAGSLGGGWQMPVGIHGYQSGGRLQPGYNIVGEAGPELLTPSGHVIPAGNDALLDEMRRVRGEIANLAQTLPTIMRDAVERLV